MPSKSSSKKKPHGGAAPAGKSAGTATARATGKSGGSNLRVRLPCRKRRPLLPKSPQQRLKVPEAMRLHGMDEERFAKKMRGLVNKLSKPNGSTKLLLDALKEWVRHFPSDRADDRASKETPVTVQLVYHIPRPVREAPAQVPPAITVEEAGE